MAGNPNIIILHGDDSDAIRAALMEMTAEIKASGMADLNLSVLEAKGLSAEDFSNAVNAVPFISEQRLVILHHPLSMAGGREGNKKFIALLDAIPQTTKLVLVIPDEIERKDWAEVGKTSFLRKWAEKNQDRAVFVTRQLPTLAGMNEWILKRAAAKGGEFEKSAVQALTAAIGNDTRLADNEIEKLLLYVDFKRPVTVREVDSLVTGIVTVSVFDMVDSLVSGNAKEALRTLHQLEEEQEIPILFAMIVRQFRLLIQCREILDEHGNAAMIQSQLGQVPFVANKLQRQASGFTMEELTQIYHELLLFDYQFKTSQSDPAAALDLLIMRVAGKR